MATRTPTRSRRPHAEGGGPGTRLDPRIRQRRVEVVRRQGRRRLRVLLSALAVGGLGMGSLAVLHSGLFAARQITVTGSVHTPTAAIVRAAGLTGHPPLVDVGPSATAGVEALPWVRRATVDVQWPDSVRITVVERTPVVVVQRVGGWALVDRTGRVLADAPAAPSGVPQLLGAGTPGPPGTELGGAAAALHVAATLPRAFAGQVAQVAEVAGGQVQLHLTTPLTVDLGTPTQLHRKYEDLAAILAGASLTAGDVINVTAPAGPAVAAPAG